MTHVAVDGVAYFDETTPNTGEHGAIALVTVEAAHVATIEEAIRKACGDLSEFKFAKMSDGRQARAAIALLDVIFGFADKGHLRIDTLSWDKNDSRHAIAGRDDYANIGRMLQHLLKNALLKWPDKRRWQFFHDQQEQVDFVRVARIANAMLQRKIASLSPDGRRLPPEILSITPSNSKQYPIIQLADMFAGLAGYLRGLNPATFHGASKAGRARLDLLMALLPWMASRTRLRFRIGEGLITERLAAINLWPYRPQGDYDRAPASGLSEHEPVLVQCIEAGCDDVCLDKWGLSAPRCPRHYAILRSAQEEAEIRAERSRRRNSGTHYCAQCATVVVVNDTMKRLNTRTYEYEYRCKICRSVLDEIDPIATSAFPSHFEVAAEEDAVRPPNVHLPRQSYRDDA